MSPAMVLSEDDQARAVTLLTALATSRSASAAHEARVALIRSGLPMAQDPFTGGPCPAEDPGAGHGVNLGCPVTRYPDGRVEHLDGHGPKTLVSRIAHADTVSREARGATTKQQGRTRG